MKIDKVVLITGGSQGIGAQTARTLAKAGYQLALNYRHNEEKALTLKQELTMTYQIKVQLYQGDISSENDVKRIVTGIKEDFGRLDILILNAGPFIHEEIKIKDYTVSQWHNMIATNLNSFFYLVKEFLPRMEQQNWGRIITFGYDQIENISGWPLRGAYAAAKTGVAAAMRSLATEEKSYNITVNMVCPGDIKANEKEATIKTARQQTSDTEKRKATGEDIARVVTFLCSVDSDYLTGNIINLSGGENIIARKQFK
ncbi:SDR family oxidoreductase [Pediococcus stilesii]|uniref:3-ketoacyl-(Acyl-carrier-protein) reductase n=1 Tax=Pediococcus stilesii TaxID=331679 RepID=A0A0R2KRZ7_9LACO|nr:SDR family NAD(P)-dependent oxidoreductase [Pediococcus stilesii]KRN92385.1 3-ketoacyl-(acyl-carrier-protein) reductase [Pediococcus stilesii]